MSPLPQLGEFILVTNHTGHNIKDPVVPADLKVVFKCSGQHSNQQVHCQDNIQHDPKEIEDD
jgi:hypothetical protein